MDFFNFDNVNKEILAPVHQNRIFLLRWRFGKPPAVTGYFRKQCPALYRSGKKCGISRALCV